MKKTRVFRAAALLAAICLLLTGCLVDVESEVHADESGTLVLREGYTQQELESMGRGATGIVTRDKFTVDGVTYFGSIQEKSFQTLDELNKLLKDFVDASTRRPARYSVERTEDGGFRLTIQTKSKEELPNDYKLAVRGSMISTAIFTLPAEVEQTSGEKNGVTIDGRTVAIDVMEAARVALDTGNKPLIFESAGGGFKDVADGAWYYKAVMAAVSKGVIHGMGGGAFSPDTQITYAQFCQLLANYRGAATEASDSYWAYGPVRWCLDQGYILDRGAVTAENYDAPMSREAAISAMMASAREEDLSGLTVKEGAADSIPDLNEVNAAYRENVRRAYTYGVTTGVDRRHSFDPQGQLTRAQVCQMYFNLGWTK